MIPLSRSRPLSINIFAAAFFAAALVSFLEGLLRIPAEQATLQKIYPAVTWTHDAVIVWRSAWLSIALIPIAMVWLSAVRLARWMVALFTLPKLLVLWAAVAKAPTMVGLLGSAWLTALLLGLLAVAMLFTPASNRWFARKWEDNPAVFE